MSVVLNFTLDPLRSWLTYRAKDNKASERDYIEQALTNEPSTRYSAEVTAKHGARARVEVVSASHASATTAPTAHREQVALAAHMRQDVLFSNAVTSDQSDDEAD